MFAVQPLLTAAAERRLLGNLQAGIEQRGVNRCLPFRLERARIDGVARERGVLTLVAGGGQ